MDTNAALHMSGEVFYCLCAHDLIWKLLISHLCVHCTEGSFSNTLSFHQGFLFLFFKNYQSFLALPADISALL